MELVGQSVPVQDDAMGAQLIGQLTVGDALVLHELQNMGFGPVRIEDSLLVQVAPFKRHRI